MYGRPIGKEEHAPAACLPCDPRAPLVARSVTGMIHQHLPSALLEHIGSTAVPGYAWKGVIDLLIPYREGELEPVKDTLQEPGFQRQSTRNSPKTVRCAWAPLDTTGTPTGSTLYQRVPESPTSFALSATGCAPIP